MQNVITLFGPTASGKTSLAIFLAQQLNGVVVNADSRQVYKNMPIITAMPSAEEFAAAEHRLFDFLEVDEKITVQAYVDLVKTEVESIWQAGKLPIICGGTGFYLKVLEEGISPVPALNEELLHRLNKRAETEGMALMHEELMQVDPESASVLKPNDTQRIIRALGVYQQTGTPISTIQKMPKQGGLKANFVKLALNPERAWLYERIHKRYDVMEKMGLLDEVKSIKAKGYNEKAHGVQSCGVKEFFKYLSGEWSLEQAKEAMLQSTRNYAKRQLTWLRGQYNADLIFTSVAHGQESLDKIKTKLLKK